ncbi:MAG: hypothetical protein ACYC2E_15185, partial [Sulfuricella sp.]
WLIRHLGLAERPLAVESRLGTRVRATHGADGSIQREYSRPIMSGWLSYDLDADGKLVVNNPAGVEAYYRFPDLTAQVEYLIATVGLSIREDFAEELRFLRGYDTAREGVRSVVDMPDRRLDLLLRLLHQNQGRLAMGRRGQFAELSDVELAQIEAAFAEAFGE